MLVQKERNLPRQNLLMRVAYTWSNNCFFSQPKHIAKSKTKNKKNKCRKNCERKFTLWSSSEVKKWVNTKTKEVSNPAVHNQIRETPRGQKSTSLNHHIRRNQ